MREIIGKVCCRNGRCRFVFLGIWWLTRERSTDNRSKISKTKYEELTHFYIPNLHHISLLL